MTDPVGRVRWIFDHEDSVVTCVQINDLHDPADGVVVVHRRPGSRGLAHDLLGALGKNHHGLGWPGEPRAWPLADLWLAAECVQHLIIYGAHRLTTDDVNRLTEIVARTRGRLWLVTRIAGQVDIRWRAALDDLLALGAARVKPHTVQEHRDAQRTMLCADENFLTFRAGCWWLLGPATLRDVEERLAAVIAATERWLTNHEEPDRWQTGALLERLLGDARDQDDVIVVLRAMQIAFFQHGWLLSCNTPALCDSSRLILNARRGGEQAAALRRVCAPDLAALGTLTACTPLDSHRLAGLRLDSIVADGGRVVCEDNHYELPAAFRGLVRAQQLSRQRMGAQPPDALFVDRAGNACPPRRIRDLARRVQEHCLSGRVPRHVDDDAGRHLGGLLSLEPLRRTERDDAPVRVPAG